MSDYGLTTDQCFSYLKDCRSFRKQFSTNFFLDWKSHFWIFGSDGSGSKICDPDWVGSIFCCSGSVSHLWLGNFPLKSPKKFLFGSKKYLQVRPNSTRVKDRSATFLLWVKSMFELGQVRAYLLLLVLTRTLSAHTPDHNTAQWWPWPSGHCITQRIWGSEVRTLAASGNLWPLGCQENNE